MIRPPLALVFLCLCSGPDALAQTSHAVFHGTPGGLGAVVAYDEQTHQQVDAPVELAGARLLPLEFHGHTRLMALEPDAPRWWGDVPGAGRIALPGAGGVLYRFERPVGDGTARFGYFLVRSNGEFVVVGERPGAGPGQDQDPYLRRVAIARDGLWILVGTTPDAGGEVFELALDGSRAHLRTVGLPPLTLGDAGLVLGTDSGWIGAREGVFRFRRQAGSRAQRVPFQPQPAWFSGELVTSKSGRRVITTAGDGPSACVPWTISLSGAAVRVDDVPRPLSRAGFLPDDLDGPYLAVSDDGTRAAWRREALSTEATREAFLREVTGAAAPAVQFTSDAFYTDTFDEVGTLSFLPQSRDLLASVGQRWLPGAGGVEGIDLFRVSLDSAGQPVFDNLTSTGSSSAPFLAPSTIDPHGTLTWLPGRDGFLLHDGDGDRLLFVDPLASGLQVLDPDVKELSFIEAVGVDLLLGVRRASGSKPHAILRLAADLSQPPIEIFTQALDESFEHPVAGPGGWLAFFGETDAGARRLHRVHVPSSQHELLPWTAGNIAPVMGISPDGDLHLSVGVGNEPARYLAWPFSGPPRLLLTRPGPGHVLPAR